jgi:hypothetical protein
LKHRTKTGAAVADIPSAGLVEQHGGPLFVAKDVLALLELRGEGVAGLHFAGVAGNA